MPDRDYDDILRVLENNSGKQIIAYRRLASQALAKTAKTAEAPAISSSR